MDYLRFTGPGADPAITHKGLIDYGAFGEVHKYHDSRNNQFFARKVIRMMGGPSHRRDIQESFENEVKVMKRLCQPGACPNIVGVLRQGETQDAPFLYIDMELCEGNLETYMQEHKPKGEAPIWKHQIWTIMAQIANGLVYIHDNKLVHRDLKPRNVLSCQQGTVWKIADFGLAAEGTSKRLQTTKFSRGTDGYRAPELLNQDNNRYNTKTDIWSMGCIMYELLMGNPAFINDWAVFEYSRAKGPFLILVEATVLGVFWGMLNNMLERNPKERQSALHFLRIFTFRYYFCPHLSALNENISSCSRLPPVYTLPFLPNGLICFDMNNSITSFTAFGGDLFQFHFYDLRSLDESTLLIEDTLFLSVTQTAISTPCESGYHFLVTVHRSGMTKIWGMTTAPITYRVIDVNAPFAVSCLAFTQDSNRLAVGSSRGYISEFHIESNPFLWRDYINPHRSFLAHPEAVKTLMYNSDGSILCSSSFSTVRIWDTKTYLQLFSTPLYSVASWFNPVRHEILFLLQHGFEIWDISGRRICSGETLTQLTCSVYSPCGEYIVMAHVSHIAIRDSRDGQLKAMIPIPRDEEENIISIQRMWFYMGDRKRLVVFSAGTLTLMNIEKYIF